MKGIVSLGRTKEIIAKHNFRFRKGLGQNFLVDGNYLAKIVEAAELNKNEVAVEIGPGIGTLTEALTEAAGWVIAVELDERLIPILEETLKERDNVSIVLGDALKVDWSQVLRERVPERLQGSACKVVANLPYYVTTPIITELLKDSFPFERMVVMVQKEVAERIVAAPGGKDYGSLSVYCQYYTEPRIAAVVPPAVFIPPPSVSSAIVVLKRREHSAVQVESEDLFFRIVGAAFGQRRKTLLNALYGSGGIPFSKDVLGEILQEAGIDPRRRGESLSIPEFARLANVMAQKANMA